MSVISFDISALNFEKGAGLVVVVTQDAVTGRVLMVAYADREAIERTVETGEMHYRSRTRGLWHKGATSGNRQRVVSLTADCDADTVLARVEALGPACHTGAATCFGDAPADALGTLDATITARTAADAATSYTRRLLNDRNLRLKKLGEETAELVLACADGDAIRANEEAADVIYHTLVALHALGVNLESLQRTLADRATLAARTTDA